MAQRISPEALYATFQHRTTQIRSTVAPWAPRWMPTALAVLTALLIVDAGFVYDDGPSIVGNPTMDPSVPFMAVFSTDIWGTPLEDMVRGYRPLTNGLWKFVWSVFPDNPVPFRLLTVLFHALATLAVTRIVQKQTSQLWMTGAAGFLFAVHPIHVEALGGITWQSDVLSSCLGLWALYFAMSDQLTWRDIIKMTCLLALCVLTKESGFLYGIACAGYLVVDGKMTLTRMTGFLTATAIVIGIAALQLSLDRSGGEFGTNNLLYGSTTETRLMLGLSVLGKGTLQLLIPSKLSPSHGYAEVTLNPDALMPMAIPGAGFLLLAAGFGVWSLWRRKGWMLVLTILWMGPILLQSGLVIPIQTDFAERLLYPSSVAMVSIAATMLGRIPGSLKTTILCFLILVSMVVMYPSLRAWESNESLWERAEQLRPKSIRTQENNGLIDLKEGRIPEGCWHLLVGTYLRLEFPKPVPWERVEAIERKYEGKERVLQAPAILSFPKSPCPLVHAYIERMEGYLPGFRNTAGRELLAKYAICAMPPSVPPTGK